MVSTEDKAGEDSEAAADEDEEMTLNGDDDEVPAKVEVQVGNRRGRSRRVTV